MYAAEVYLENTFQRRNNFPFLHSSTQTWVYLCESTYVSLPMWVYLCESTYVSLPLCVYLCESTYVSLPMWVYPCESTNVSLPISLYLYYSTYIKTSYVSLPMWVYLYHSTYVTPSQIFSFYHKLYYVLHMLPFIHALLSIHMHTRYISIKHSASFIVYISYTC